MTALQSWLARQPATVKLAVALPLLLAAVVWSTWFAAEPGTSSTGNGPVLSGATTVPAPDRRGVEGPAGTSAPDAPATPAERRPLAPHQEPVAASGGSLTWASALWTVFSVGLVIVLIVVSARLLKYLLAAAGQPATSGGALRVLETTYLPAPSGRGRAAIHLMEVGDRVLVIGATDTQLSLLAELDREPAPGPTTGAARAMEQPAGGLSFGDALAAIRNGPVHPPDALVAPQGTSGAARRRGSAGPSANGVAGSHTAAGSPGQDMLADMLRRLRESKSRLELGS